VETCNTTLSPSWGISEASRLRLAKLAVAMFRAGILGSLTRKHIIGHYEVPGTYATSCPGPEMRLDYIVKLANDIYKGSGLAGLDTEPIKPPTNEDDMKHIFSSGSAAGTGAVIAYSSGYVSVLVGEEKNRWNERCAALGLPVTDKSPRNAERAIEDRFLQSFLHIEAGLPMDWDLNAKPVWHR
jgi:hypothetical protein